MPKLSVFECTTFALEADLLRSASHARCFYSKIMFPGSAEGMSLCFPSLIVVCVVRLADLLGM